MCTHLPSILVAYILVVTCRKKSYDHSFMPPYLLPYSLLKSLYVQLFLQSLFFALTPAVSRVFHIFKHCTIGTALFPYITIHIKLLNEEEKPQSRKGDAFTLI